MFTKTRFNISSRILLGAVVLLLVLSFIPTPGGSVIEILINKAGIGAVERTAQGYLREQREQALEGFLVLSALKVGLAVLRSSEIGLVLNVRVGDVAVAVYDYVNFAWKVLLAAVAYYYLAQFLLDLAASVDIWFIWTALACSWLVLTFAVLGKRPGKTVFFLTKTGTAAAVLALIMYLGLPLAFVGAGWVSHNITGSTIKDANRVFQEFTDDMPGILEKNGEAASGQTGIKTPSVTVPVPYDGSDPSRAVIGNRSGEIKPSPKVSGLGFKEKLDEMRNYLAERSRSLASTVIRQTAAYLFNIVVFPLLTILMLYWGGKYILALSAPDRSSVQNAELSRHLGTLSDAVARLEKTAGKWNRKE